MTFPLAGIDPEDVLRVQKESGVAGPHQVRHHGQRLYEEPRRFTD